jgi:hypothetical protein
MPKLILVVGMLLTSALAVADAGSPRRRPGVLIAGSGADSIVTGHFNSDRRLDLAVANRDASTISLFMGRGNGRFAPARTLATGPSPRSLRAADVNGDGKLDLLTANAEGNTVSVLLGIGRGRFRRMEVPMCEACRPLAIETADFNGDAHTDVAVALVGSNQISVLAGHGDGTFNSIDSAGSVRDDPVWIESGDFNRDGNVDLATANFDFVAVSTIHGNGDGTFRTGPEYVTGDRSRDSNLAVADLNNDGFVDLAVPNPGRESVSLFLGDGAGHFAPGSELQAGAQPVFVSVGDFNADSRRDLAVANSAANTVTIFLGEGGSAPFRRSQDLATGGGPVAIATADFNRDRQTDMAVTNRNDGTVSVFLSMRRRREHQRFGAPGVRPEILGERGRRIPDDLLVCTFAPSMAARSGRTGPRTTRRSSRR